MLSFRQILIASLLLAGLVVGCQSKSQPGRSEDSKLTPGRKRSRKHKKSLKAQNSVPEAGRRTR